MENEHADEEGKRAAAGNGSEVADIPTECRRTLPRSKAAETQRHRVALVGVAKDAFKNSPMAICVRDPPVDPIPSFS